MRFLLLFFPAFFLLGCVAATTQEVFIPVKCGLTIPERPTIGNKDRYEALREVFVYVEVLEMALKECNGPVNP